MGNSQLFIIGDSISMHYGPYLKQALLGNLDVSRKGDLPGEENLDANGRDSNEVVSYMQALIKRQFKTDLLLLNCGLHDIKHLKPDGIYQVEPQAYQRNLEQIITLFTNLAPRLIWVSTTPVDDATHNSRNKEFERFNADVLRYNQIAQAVMSQAGLAIIDLNRFTAQIGDPESLYEDHVHFPEEIRRLQGDFIAGCLELMFEAGE